MILDIGNSRVKAAIFEEDILLQELVFDGLDGLIGELDDHTFDFALVSSVKWTENELRALLPFDFIFLTRSTQLPIVNKYTTPETLGVDRTAAVIGGLVFEPDNPVLVIDLGTCITFEFLGEGWEYSGGAISPGIQMRFKAMHLQTARLPLVPFRIDVGITGDSTTSCLQSGVFYGVKFEIEGAIAHYKSLYPNLKVFICGGDSIYFESLIKDYIFVIPNLVLYGLNRILRYNVNKN